MTNEAKIVKTIKFFIWCLPIVLGIYIINMHFVPFGKFTVVYRVNHENSLIPNFASSEPDKLVGTVKTAAGQEYFQLLTQSLTKFDVKVPRAFASATVTVKYQNPDKVDFLELGSRRSNKSYLLIPLASKIDLLDSLPDYWQVINQGNILLWQKNQQYYHEKKEKQAVYQSRKKVLDAWRAGKLKGVIDPDEIQNINNSYQTELNKITEGSIVIPFGSVKFHSVDQFFSSLPPQNEILQSNYDLSRYFQLRGYKKADHLTEINKNIRGAHEIYTYIGDNEILNYVLTILDLNRNPGGDTLDISVYDSRGNLITKQFVTDDGEVTASNVVLPERQIKLELPDLHHGVYRLVIKTTDDIFFKKIVTSQHLVMFKKNLYLADNIDSFSNSGQKSFSSTILYTDSSFIQAHTSHQAGLQTLKIGTKDLVLDEIHKSKAIYDLKEVTTIASPKNDVYLEGDRYFAFNKDQLFDPNASTVPSINEAQNVDDFNYIIATYPQPKVVGDWLIASATLNAPALNYDGGSLLTTHLALNMPGMQESGKTLKINEVKIEFNKDPITIRSFFVKLANWIKKVMAKTK